MWFFKLIRQFFFSIDNIIFNFISTLYDLLISIARTSFLSQVDIIEMADRIYKLLAVFMVFKVTFSLIMYVVNPDDFSDKTKGVSKLGLNIVISLLLLITTPYIFKYAYQFQTIILEDNSLATLIFGEDKANNNILNTAGDTMAYVTMTPFFAPDPTIAGLEKCNNVDKGCLDDLAKLADGNKYFSKTDYDNYRLGIEKGSLGLMFRKNMVLATDSKKDDFIIDYRFLFSTVVGIIIVLLLISFCLDVAVRSIKLAFLQLVAPIPIISYVDPKSGKDGLFKKWYQMCIKTYLSLFLRIIAIYFAIYVIGKVGKLVDIIDGSYVTNGIIKIFIIIGALMFAKQLPKILEGLGLKLDGGFQLNPLRKVEKEALGGGLLKKPNDMLGRMGKGLALAPVNGLKTGGKKFIGGIDAARSGKGFWNGVHRTHGTLYNNFYKKLDEWAPDSAEIRKNERLGREEVKQMNRQWSDGKKIADKLYNYGEKKIKPFDLLDGQNREAYKILYGNNETFINSRMALDRADNTRKILQNISNSAMQGQSIESSINAKRADISKLSADDQKIFAKMLNAGSDAERHAILNDELDKKTKQVSGMEKVHESIRKQNHRAAYIEDVVKFVKNNPIDPTDPNRNADYEVSNEIQLQQNNVSQQNNDSQQNNERLPLTDPNNLYSFDMGDSTFTPQQSQSTPQQSEPAPQQSQSTPQQSEPAPQQNESTPQQSEPAPQQNESTPQQSSSDTSASSNGSIFINSDSPQPRMRTNNINVTNQSNEPVSQQSVVTSEQSGSSANQFNDGQRIMDITNEIIRLTDLKNKTTEGEVFDSCVRTIKDLQETLNKLQKK